MSNVIQFLESLGSNPSFVRNSAAEFAANVAMLDADDGQRDALLDRDHAALSALIGGRQKMYCAVYAPDEEQKDDDQPDQEEPLQDAPAQSE